MADLYEYSTPELVRLLGMRFKEYRMRCNLTQKEVAELTGLGLTTIHKFENGTAGNLSLATFLPFRVYNTDNQPIIDTLSGTTGIFRKYQR